MPRYDHTGRMLDQLREMERTLDGIIITCQGLRIQVSGLMQAALNEKVGALSLNESGLWENCLNCQCHECRRLDNGCTEKREGVTNNNACPCDGCEEGLPFKPKSGPACLMRSAKW